MHWNSKILRSSKSMFFFLNLFLGSGFRFGFEGLGGWVWGVVGFMVLVVGCWVLGFWVWGLGFWDSNFGVGVLGSEFGV